MEIVTTPVLHLLILSSSVTKLNLYSADCAKFDVLNRTYSFLVSIVSQVRFGFYVYRLLCRPYIAIPITVAVQNTIQSQLSDSL
jgi:hypothetical protein